MAFFRLVEVFAPSRPAGAEPWSDPSPWLARLAREVKAIAGSADLFLVADRRDAHAVQLSPVRTAAFLQEEAGVRAAPTIVARDSTASGLRSAVLTAVSLGLRSVFLARGDPSPGGTADPYGYRVLSELISEAHSIARRAGVDLNLFAPVHLDSLAGRSGAALARSRLDAGARLLLAQPPTTDPGATFARHSGLVEAAGLKDRVLLNVFPFRDAADVDACAARFGWDLPDEVRAAAVRGRQALLREAGAVVTAARREGLPGVYFSTRGETPLAPRVLGALRAGKRRRAH